jgi:predicted metal-dependent phosphotriesterase family hydrolase
MDNLSRTVIPMLLAAGVSSGDIDKMMIGNPRRLLEPAK